MNNQNITRQDIFNFIENNLDFMRVNFHISKIGIFGSFSRDEADENSDIDLIIEFDGKIDEIFETKEKIREFFQNAFGREVDIVREKFLKPRASKRILDEVLYVS